MLRGAFKSGSNAESTADCLLFVLLLTHLLTSFLLIVFHLGYEL